jgi:hypothetical protein
MELWLNSGTSTAGQGYKEILVVPLSLPPVVDKLKETQSS